MNAAEPTASGAFRAVDQTDLENRVSEFKALSPEAFFEQHETSPAFILAAPKQKAISRVLRGALENLEGRILVKRANKRDAATYAIDTETGTVFGFTEMKPGGLANAFSMRATLDSPKASRFVKSDIDAQPAPVIGIIGEDTYQGLKTHEAEKMRNVGVIKKLNTSHSGLYLGARNEEHLQKIGQEEMTIAVTDRYEPILRDHLEGMKKQSDTPHNFIMPELVSCDGGTEDYLDSYGDIDVICDIVDGGGSMLNAKISHAQLLKRSGAVVVRHANLTRSFPEQADEVDAFLDLLEKATNEHFQTTHPHLFEEGASHDPSQYEIMTTEQFFKVMELDIGKARRSLSKNEDKPFYDLGVLAA